jgi:hypothetical protein
MGVDSRTFNAIGFDLNAGVSSCFYGLKVDIAVSQDCNIKSFFTSAATDGAGISKTLAGESRNRVTLNDGQALVVELHAVSSVQSHTVYF